MEIKIKEYKNYKQLCEENNLKIKSGKSKKIHIAEIERVYDTERVGNKIIVTGRKDNLEEKIDRRINNGGHIGNTIYDDLMDKLVLDMLSEYNRGKYVEDSFNGFFVDGEIPLISNEYSKILENGYLSYSAKLGISKGITREYAFKLRGIVTKCFETSLNRLQKQGLITWNKSKKVNVGYGDPRLATDDEIDNINKAEKLAYEELGISSNSRINQKINRQFKKFVISELDCDIFSYWNVYCIDLLTDIEPQDTDIQELTNRMIIQIHKAISNRKCVNEYGIIFKPYETEQHISEMIKLDSMLFINYDDCFVDTKNRTFANYEFVRIMNRNHTNKENIEYVDSDCCMYYDKETDIYLPF